MRAKRSLVVLAAVASCLGRPPEVPSSATLAPGAEFHGAAGRAKFQIAYAGPRKEAPALDDPGITLVFNRPMRAIDAPEDAGVPDVRVETAEGALVAGKATFLGTRGVLFAPDAPLPGSTRFKVTVAGTTKSLEGDTLGAPYGFEFETPRVHLVRTLPAAGSRELRPADRLRVQFDQPVRPEALRTALELRVAGEKVPFTVAALDAKDTVEPRFSREAFAWVAAAKPFPLDAAVEVRLPAGARVGAGPLAPEKPELASFRTYAPLRLADVRCPKVDQGRCQAHRDLTLVFDNPVSPAELESHLAHPIPRLSLAAALKAPTPRRDHVLGVDPAEGKRYRVTIKKGLRDAFGQVLERDLAVDVDIEDPFVAPSGAKPAAQAVASGPADPTDDPRPRRPLPSYETELGIRGRVLEAGVAHKIPIGAVNIPTVGLSAEGFPLGKAIEWHLGRERRPDDAWAWAWWTPAVPRDTRAVKTLDLDALLALTTGARSALLGLYAPGGSVQSRFVSVTDLGVTGKVSRYGNLVWVTRLATGAPVSGATVELVTEKGTLFSGQADGSGLVAIPDGPFHAADLAKQRAVLVVKSGNDWTVEPIEQGTADRRALYEREPTSARGEQVGVVYTERGVYRPGEGIHVAGLVRTSDAGGLRAVAKKDVRIELYDGNDARAFTGAAQTDAFGSFAAEVPIPKGAHLGDARITATVSGQTFSTDLHLAAYKASEFEVKVDPDRPSWIEGQLATVRVRGNYLYGAPMIGAAVETRVSHDATTYRPPGSDGFAVSDDAYSDELPNKGKGAGELQVENGSLDPKGEGKFDLPLAFDHDGKARVVTFEAEVSDLTNQKVARAASFVVHPADFYVGLKRPARRFFAVGARVPVEVAAFEPAGTRRAGVKVKVELYGRSWTSATKDVAGDQAQREGRANDTVVSSCEATTAQGAAKCDLLVPAAGYFVLRATAVDGSGRPTRASQRVYAVDDRSDAPAPVTTAFADPEGRTLKLDLDRDTYEPGQSAKVLVRSPFKEADALVTVERGGVLARFVTHVKGPMPVVDVPVKAEYFPNVFVSVHLVRGRVAKPPQVAAQADVGAPDFRVGYKELRVDPESHRLKATIATPKKEYAPGEEVDADVTVVGAGGAPARATVTMYAVDEGVLMLTGYRTPDPLPEFTVHRRSAVFGLDNRESLARILPMRAGERVPPRGFQFLGPDRDGDGIGDKGEDGGGGGDALRADFRTTAFFEAGRVAEGGKARFHFKLPDNLTAFRLMAVVAAEDDRFGFGEAQITTSKALMGRPALPRVVRVGDRFDAGVIVSGKGFGAPAVTVSLATKNLSGAPASRVVALPKDGQVEVRFPVVADKEGPAELLFSVSGGGKSDQVRVSRTVELPLASEVVAAYGEVADAASVGIGDLAKTRDAKLEVHLATSALVGVSQAFDQLWDYPYGCTEQVTSKLVPLVLLSDMAKSFQWSAPGRVDAAIEDGVLSLLQHQQGSGGFAFWNDGPSIPWLSAWAIVALDAAAKNGHYVPRDALERGREYLLRVLGEVVHRAEHEGDGPHGEEARPSEDDEAPEGDATTLAEAAFVLDALATIGSPDPAAATTLYAARAKLPLSSAAALLHALAKARAHKGEIGTLQREIEARLRVGPSEAVAEGRGEDGMWIDSPARTTALVLRALVAVEPAHAAAPKLARGLLGLRKRGAAWASTQENAWALLALDDYRRAQEPSLPAVDAKAWLGAGRILDTRLGPGPVDSKLLVDTPLLASAGAGARLTFESTGHLFWSAALRYGSTELPTKPADEGIFVQKIVRGVSAQDLEKITRARLPRSGDARALAGQLVLVDVLVETAEPREQVVLDDPLPAGLEPIDTDLETGSALVRVGDEVTQPGARKRRSLYGGGFRVADGVHREHHDDRVLTFASHLEPGLYHFRYLTRATTPGRFVVPPTRVECMYDPSVYGRTAASTFEVAAKP